MNKVCKKCGTEKPLTSFYKHKEMRDGYLNICQICVVTRVKSHRALNIEKIRAYDRLRGLTEKRKAKVKLYFDKNKHKKTLYSKKWGVLNREKKRAQLKLKRAVQAGKLKRLPCSRCGDPKSHGHHYDYSKPLKVKWLCAKHHGAEHRGFRQLFRYAKELDEKYGNDFF